MCLCSRKNVIVEEKITKVHLTYHHIYDLPPVRIAYATKICVRFVSPSVLVLYSDSLGNNSFDLFFSRRFMPKIALSNKNGMKSKWYGEV